MIHSVIDMRNGEVTFQRAGFTSVVDMRLGVPHGSGKPAARSAQARVHGETQEYLTDVHMVLRERVPGDRMDAVLERRDYFASHTDRAYEDAEAFYLEDLFEDLECLDPACDCPNTGDCIWCSDTVEDDVPW